MTDRQLLCIHRHSQSSHPACFDSNRIPINIATTWYQGLKIGYLDIETDGLKADFSTMLSWCIKEQNGKIYSNSITKEEIFSGKSDQRLIEDLIKEINKYNIIVTYYGIGFDIPYLRAKALHYGLEFPGFVKELLPNGRTIIHPSIYHWDLYFTIKSKLNLTRKSLGNVCDYLGISGKTDIDKEIWRQAKYGDPKAIKQVLLHNKGDVIILEQLHNRIWELGKWNRNPL